MQSAAAVALMPLVADLLLRTLQQRLAMLFSGPANPKNCVFPLGDRDSPSNIE